MNRRKPETERRKWSRLPLAIPVFVRSSDGTGKDLLEFATALNVSAGGALIAVRRSLPVATDVTLEIPSAPLVSGDSLPKSNRMIQAQTLRVTHAEGYHLIGVKFAHPLLKDQADRVPTRRKLTSSV